MRASVVVRSKDEADRLRLTLRSLSRQTVAPQVVVVNDGSTDATEAVLDEAEPLVELVELDLLAVALVRAATSALAWTVVLVVPQALPVGCWARSWLITESIREPAPIPPGG